MDENKPKDTLWGQTDMLQTLMGIQFTGSN